MAEDPLFNTVDSNKDGVIDRTEWQAAQDSQILPSASEALETFLGSFDPDGSGRLDAAEVNSAISCFNSVDKRDRLGGEGAGGQMQQCPSGEDGKVSRAAVRGLFELFKEGPPARELGKVLQVFQELQEIKESFLRWSGGKPALDAQDVHTACIVFNKWSDHTCPGNEKGRMLMNYYDPSIFGADVDLPAFSKWLWQELSVLEETFQQKFQTMLLRVKASIRIATVLRCHEWEGLNRVAAALVGPLLAACDGQDWGALDASAREEVAGRVAQSCGVSVAADGSVAPADLRKWAREEVVKLPGERLDAALQRLEEFAARCEAAQECLGSVTSSFRKWDKDGNGVIGRKELRAFLSKIGDFSEEELDALLQGADLNGDGRIDYAEFAKWVMAGPDVE